MIPRGHVRLVGDVYPSVRERVRELRWRTKLRIGDILTIALEHCPDEVWVNVGQLRFKFGGKKEDPNV